MERDTEHGASLRKGVKDKQESAGDWRRTHTVDVEEEWQTTAPRGQSDKCSDRCPTPKVRLERQ
jgi:hypothetical protein